MRKKITSMLLAVAMVATMLPAAVFANTPLAAETATVYITDKTNTEKYSTTVDVAADAFNVTLEGDVANIGTGTAWDGIFYASGWTGLEDQNAMDTKFDKHTVGTVELANLGLDDAKNYILVQEGDYLEEYAEGQAQSAAKNFTVTASHFKFATSGSTDTHPSVRTGAELKRGLAGGISFLLPQGKGAKYVIYEVDAGTTLITDANGKKSFDNTQSVTLRAAKTVSITNNLTFRSEHTGATAVTLALESTDAAIAGGIDVNKVHGDSDNELTTSAGFGLTNTNGKLSGAIDIKQTAIETGKIAAVIYGSATVPAGTTPTKAKLQVTWDGVKIGTAIADTTSWFYHDSAANKVYFKCGVYFAEQKNNATNSPFYKRGSLLKLDAEIMTTNETVLATGTKALDFTAVTGLGGKAPEAAGESTTVLVTPPSPEAVGVVTVPATTTAMDAALAAANTLVGAGTYSKIALAVAPIPTPAPAIDSAVQAAAGGRVLSYLDITLNAIATGASADTPIATVTQEIPITLELPTALRGKTNYQVIRYHGTTATALPTTVSGNTIKFSTNKFSTYAIAYSNAGGGGGYWYGGWAGSSDITVSFYTNGGSYVNPVKMSAGGTIDPYKYIPTRSGYAFGGWYTDSGLTKVVNANTRFDANTTLYVRWLEESVTAPAPSTPTTGATSNPQTGDSWFANLFA